MSKGYGLLNHFSALKPRYEFHPITSSPCLLIFICWYSLAVGFIFPYLKSLFVHSETLNYRICWLAEPCLSINDPERNLSCTITKLSKAEEQCAMDLIEYSSVLYYSAFTVIQESTGLVFKVFAFWFQSCFWSTF